MGNNALPRARATCMKAMLPRARVAPAARRFGALVAERLLDAVALARLRRPGRVAGLPLGLSRRRDRRSSARRWWSRSAARPRARARPGSGAPAARAVRRLLAPTPARWRAAGRRALGLSLALWLVEGVVYAMLGRVAGRAPRFADGLYVMALANLAAMVPAAPGYVGTYDAAVLLGVRLVGGGAARVAVPYVVLVRFVLFVPITLVGLVALVGRYGGLRTARGWPLRRQATGPRSSGSSRPAPSGRSMVRAAGIRSRSAQTNGAPGPSSSASPSVAAHALGELAADGQAEPEAALAAGRLPRWKRSKIRSRSSGGTPGPGRRPRCRVLAVVGGDDPHGGAVGREAQRVVEQDAHDPGHRARVAARPARARRRHDLERDARARRRAARTPRRPRGTARRAPPARVRSGIAGVQPAEVEQLGGEVRQAPQLRLRARRPGAAASSRSSAPVVRGPRRAARACPAARSAACAARARRSPRTRAAPPPGGAAPPASPASARARSPTSSWPSSRGGGASGALGGHAQRGARAGAPSRRSRVVAARGRAASATSEADARPRPGTRRGPGRRRVDVGQRLAAATSDEVLVSRSAGASSAHREVDRRRRPRCRARRRVVVRAEDGRTRPDARRGRCRDRRTGIAVGDDHARVRARGERVGEPRATRRSLPRRRSRARSAAVNAGRGRQHGGLSEVARVWRRSRSCSGGSSASAADGRA